MSQKKSHSLLEAIANVAIAMVIGLVVQLIMYPALMIPVTFGQNLQILGIMTAVSLIRSYCLRRLFNRLTRNNQESNKPCA